MFPFVPAKAGWVLSGLPSRSRRRRLVPEVGIAPTSPRLQRGANLSQLLGEMSSPRRSAESETGQHPQLKYGTRPNNGNFPTKWVSRMVATRRLLVKPAKPCERKAQRWPFHRHWRPVELQCGNTARLCRLRQAWLVSRSIDGWSSRQVTLLRLPVISRMLCF